MSRTTPTRSLLALSGLLALAACADLITGRRGPSLSLSDAFRSVPAGFSSATNSFAPAGDQGTAFFPDFTVNGAASADKGPGGPSTGSGKPEGHPDDHGKGPGIPGDGFLRELMGGGLGPNFIGAVAFGRGKGHGPFGLFDLPSTCTFDSGSGRVSCPSKTERDLTVKVSFAFKDTAGKAQAKFDTLTTNSVNIQTEVSGTKTRKDSSTSKISNKSDYTVSGLAGGSTKRTVNGNASAHEESTGKRDSVSFSATRDVADTTKGLVIPVEEGKKTTPTAGTVIRVMKVSVTPSGGDATTKTRREVVTFNGTESITIVVTEGDTTKTCTFTLPNGPLSCS